MEKEKLLKQLEEKLLPSVQNLEKGQANEHDYFPALLWLLLDKSNDTEKALSESEKKNEELLKSGVNFIYQGLCKKLEGLKNLIFILFALHIITLIGLAFIIFKK